MTWYDDRSRTEFVGKYASPAQFQRDLRMASTRGWFVLVGEEGPDAVAAGNSSDRITVTFRRSADWLAAREREVAAAVRDQAARAADDKEAVLLRALEALQRAEQVFSSLRSTGRATDEPIRVEFERDLLAACKDLISKRQRVLKALDDAVKEMAEAVALGVSEFAASLSRYQSARDEAASRLELELALLREQEVVVRAAREWSGASERHRAAEATLQKRTLELRARESELTAGLEGRDHALQALAPD